MIQGPTSTIIEQLVKQMPLAKVKTFWQELCWEWQTGIGDGQKSQLGIKKHIGGMMMLVRCGNYGSNENKVFRSKGKR